MVLNGGGLTSQTDEYITVDLNYIYDGRKVCVTNHATGIYYELYIRGAGVVTDVTVHVFPDEDNPYTDGDIVNMVHSIVYHSTEHRKRKCLPTCADLLNNNKNIFI